MQTFFTFKPTSKEDMATLGRHISFGLSLINDWLQIIKLSLNAEKTNKINDIS